MNICNTPPLSGPNIPKRQVSTTSSGEAVANFATPTSIAPTSPMPNPQTSTPKASTIRTQNQVEADPKLRRLQQDLLVLTGLNDNSTLHWRPVWFEQEPHNKKFWTLHNPPNVVTEKLPRDTAQGKDYYTRRMRRTGDPPTFYIKSWDQWSRYCDMYGVPLDFLSEDQINLMRLGLARDEHAGLRAAPSYPLYPEPQPLGCGRYILDPSTYTTHLPGRFRSVDYSAASPEDVKVIVVHSDGALTIEREDEIPKGNIQWPHYDGKGESKDDAVYAAQGGKPKQQGPGRRWSHVPWTSAQEESCKQLSLVIRLRVNLKRKFGTDSGDVAAVKTDETEGKDKKTQKMNRLLRELQ